MSERINTVNLSHHNNMKTNVAFIYMLPSISEGYVDEYNQPEEQENIPWWKKIFS